MRSTKDLIIRRIKARSLAEARYLAGEFARSAAAEREQILAALEYERWLAETCRVAQNVC